MSRKKLTGSKVLVTGGAGFIGSNLVDYFLSNGNEVVCLDNLSTGFRKNLTEAMKNSGFHFIEGDIRDLETCKRAVRGCDYVFHEAALGSVPRSINDPASTNSVNIDGFLNMLIASREEKVKRFVYAASSSTYGDSTELPKVEHIIGRPLSPYAITKLVNEYFAKVFSELYGLETIGLRYFNVFGRRQDPNGAYAAVIPLWVKSLMNYQSPVINGDGNYSRDFTYVDNVIHANERAVLTTKEELLKNLEAYNGEKRSIVFEVFNTAYGENTSLFELFEALNENLSAFDKNIKDVSYKIGPKRQGDIPHSLASIDKARKVIGYNPGFNFRSGIREACRWYFENLK